MDNHGRRPWLREQVQEVIRTRRYSLRAEKRYWYWIRYFIRFHGVRHPAEMGEEEGRKSLTWLATRRGVAAATRNRALSALAFLYAKGFDRPLGDIGAVVHANRARANCR